MAKDESSKDDDDILDEARERFRQATDRDAENRRQQREDTAFVYISGRQWADDVRARRQAWDDPCMEFNQLPQFIHQIVNDQRQNRPGVRIHPASGQASKEVADILQGMIRGIEYASEANAAYDGGYQHAVVGGRGYWRICSGYTEPGSFDQDLQIKRIADPMSVYMDPDFQDPDGSDINYCFIVEAIEPDEFKRQYPDADPESWEKQDGYWQDGDKIFVADYYRRVCRKRTLVATTPGPNGEAPAMGYKDEMPSLPDGVTIAHERDVDDYTVEWYKIAGGEQILKKYDWPGTIIPVVCCMGDNIMIDGKRTFQGAIRNAKTPQQMFNYGMNAQAVRLALTPRAPYIIAEGQIEGYEDQWANANKRNYSVLTYKPADLNGQPVPPPQRTEGSMVDQGWTNWTQQMQGLLRSCTGMYQSSLGMQGQEISGRAIMAREKQGDNATFHYVDNESRAIALTGRILVEVIPAFYDTQRIVQIIGTDDIRQMVTINQNTPNPANPLEAIKRNDVSVGTYAVTVQAGPSYTTKRQEAADSMMQFVQSFPPASQVAGDLIAGAMDWPDADAIADRLKTLLPPQIQQMEAAKEAGQNPRVAQMQQQLQQMQQQMQQMQQAAQAKIQELAQANQVMKDDRSIKLQASTMKHDTDQASVLVDFVKAIIPLLQTQGLSAIPESGMALQAGDSMLFQGAPPPVPAIAQSQMPQLPPMPPPRPMQPGGVAPPQ